MAETNHLFDWEIESFNDIAAETNLLELRRKFRMSQHSLSESLLIWEKFGVTGSWLLADFRNKKIYHIDKRNDVGMEVSEASWDPEYPRSRFDDQPYGTHEGFVDWLQLFNLAQSDLVLCQSLIEGYSFLSLIRASSVVNRQWTVVPC